MVKVKITYQLINGHAVYDEREFKNFGEALARMSRHMNTPVITIVKNESHVIEIPTTSIVYHEVEATTQP